LGCASAADLAGERDDEQDGQNGTGQEYGGGHICSLAGLSGEWVKKRQNARLHETDVPYNRALAIWRRSWSGRAAGTR
jgi:hypothetical protein